MANNDSPRVKNKTSQLITQANEEVKQHIVYDSADRIKYIFTAGIDTLNGKPCSVVEYVYRNPTSTQVIDMQERASESGWEANWGSGFTFDPDTAYDVDGDGDL